MNIFETAKCHIEDVADGIVSTLDTSLGHEIINLGCGNPISLIDFINIIEELTGTGINKISSFTVFGGKGVAEAKLI